MARRVRYLRTKDAHKQLARTSYVIVCVACLFRLVELGTSYIMCSVLVSIYRLKNELCYMCSVLVST